MDSLSQRPSAHRCNVLALDGGGVRGLSSLIILQRLMGYINTKLRDHRQGEETHDGVEPRDVFDLVAGTSTGGLIAIMLGRLGMTLEDSIQAYNSLSKKIFAKKHIRGTITHGLAATRYSGHNLECCIQDLIKQRGFPETISMASEDNSDEIACAVICREHVDQSKYSNIKAGAVPICSLGCEQQFACLVSEAARATSAAPTFFPRQKIGNRYFVDGGMQFNNPSHAIYNHYSRPAHMGNSERTSSTPEVLSTKDHHGGLDFSLVRVVNLGTGTESQELPPRQRYRLAALVPGFIRMLIFLKKTLTDIAVEAEVQAGTMRSLIYASSGNVKYERFSADNGVCYIKMDKYKELELIKILTTNYLDNKTVQDTLKKVGEEIATDYLLKHGHQPDIGSSPSTTLTVPNPNPSSSRHTPSQTLEASEPGTSVAASSNNSCKSSNGQIQNDRNPSEQIGDLTVSSKMTASPDIDTMHLSVDMMAPTIKV